MVKATTVLSSVLLVVSAAISTQTSSIKSYSLSAKANVEYIAGLVLYRVIDGNINYVLLQKADELDDWSVPKGHIEEGEDAHLGAVRETFEETAYLETDYFIYSQEKIKFEYSNNDGVAKIVTLFPAKLTSVDKPVVTSEEHNAYTWVDYENGFNLIKKHYKTALTQAHSFITVQESLHS